MDNSQTYSWSPSTTQQQGLPVPKFYGVNRVFGNIVNAYLYSEGTKQYSNAIIGLGVGPWKRLYDFKINDQPAGSFQGVIFRALLGSLDQVIQDPFRETKVEYPLSVKIVKPTAYTYTTIGNNFHKLEVEVTFPQGLWRQIYSLSNYSVQVRVSVRRQGDSEWTILTWEPYGYLWSAGGHWSAGKWTLWNQQWYWCDYRDLGSDPYKYRGGETYRVSTVPLIEYVVRWIGEPIQTVTGLHDYVTVTASQMAPIRKTFSVENLATGTYEIKIENLTDDQTAVSYGDDMFLSAVREVSTDSFNYPRLALVAVKALATDQLSGSLRFSCMAECSYLRYWTGTEWAYDASDNPAWCSWDAFTQPVIDDKESDSLLSGYEHYNAQVGRSFRILRYDGMDPSRLDLAKWKDWADWCDELVPDGTGGTEKRITFNGGFDTRGDLWRSATQICQVGRAVPVWNGINLTIAVDKAASSVQLFTAGNIGTDSFRETFLKQADRASSVSIDFTDRDNGYARDICDVNEDNIPGSNAANIPMIGITKRSEAWRYGKYRLYNNLYVKRSIEIDAGIDAIACTIGDVINVQHDVPHWGDGGRIVSAGSSEITIDREVVIEADKTYTIMIRLADDSVVSRAVTNTPGAYTILTVSSPFSVIPEQYDLYAYGETEKVVKPFRVMRLSRPQDLNVTISAVEYNESIYGADALLPVVVVPTPNYSSLEVLPPVAELILDELLISRQDGTIDDVIDVYFARPRSEFYRAAEIWYNSGGGWIYAGKTASDRFRIPNVQVGVSYSVAVVTVNVLNDKTKIQNAPHKTISTMGKLDPPSNVTGFAATQNGQFVNFSWTHIPDADLWGYEMREGSTWESGRLIASGISADRHAWQAELNGTYRFLIKAIDSSGLYSTTASSVDITLANINENINVVLSQDEITKGGGPDGVETNMVFVSGIPALMLPHTLLDTDVPGLTDQTADISGYAGDVDLHAEYESLAMDTLLVGDTWSRILAEVDAYDLGANDQSYPSRTDRDFPQDTDMHITMPVVFALYLSYSTDNVAWSDWELYTGTVQKTFRYVKVQFIADLGSVTGVLKLMHLLVSMDVPDVTLTIPNFAVTTGTGDTLSFATYGKQFYTAPVVTATLIGGVTNKVPVISSKTNTGFHLDLRDKADASVAGTVDIRISGY